MKTAKENLLSVLAEKKILFIEGDDGLYNGLDRLEKFFKANKVKYKCLFDVRNQKLPKILKAIDNTDVIIFQTTWTYDIATTLKRHVSQLKDKKIIIEHYIYEPSWFKKPDVVHDVYVLKTPGAWGEDDEFLEWRFYKLHPTKGIWMFKNKFDK